MQLTLNIDLSNNKALALINYIRTLEFVTFTEDFSLTKKEQQAIDVGIDAIKKGQSFKHEEVMLETKKRYPNLF